MWNSQQLAERWLQDFYTRLSTEPGSLHYLYMESAEVVYTGQLINPGVEEAYLMSGRPEIASWFATPGVVARFYGSRIKVDDLHPVNNPMCVDAYSISVRGVLFLVTQGFYEPVEFVHFLLLTPLQRFANQMPNYKLANEFFHMRGRVGPPAEITPAPSAAGLPGTEPPLLSHPPHMQQHQVVPVLAQPPQPAPAAPPAAAHNEHPRSAAHQNRKERDELSVHASPTTPEGIQELRGMPTEKICEHVNKAMQTSGNEVLAKGKCLQVIRPSGTSDEESVAKSNTGAPVRTFFFLHFDKTEVAEELKKLGTLEVSGYPVKVSNIMRRTGGSGGGPRGPRKHLRGGALHGGNGNANGGGGYFPKGFNNQRKK